MTKLSQSYIRVPDRMQEETSSAIMDTVHFFASSFQLPPSLAHQVSHLGPTAQAFGGFAPR